MDINEVLYLKLPNEKIAINFNDNPIKMDLFLRFLEIPVERSFKHLGSTNGWTMLINKREQLYIRGGIVNGVEYLDSIKYKKNEHNDFNDFVTPFQIAHHLNKEGKSFFLKYYSKEIEILFSNQQKFVHDLSEKLAKEQEKLLLIEREFSTISHSFDR